ncbi:hypothetical protein [Streptomyces sp. cmx-18-6]|uniref:hypothetical protein n=1 Tax=Streptomyces sp. cmx-18-6 TaxID=2790930 RepID=UPI00397F2DD6
MDTSVLQSISRSVGHQAPFEDAELGGITSISVTNARTLNGLELLRSLRILIMNGCDVPSVAQPLCEMTSLRAVISKNSALRDVSGLGALQLDRMDLQRNRIDDLSPLLDQKTLMEVNVVGNPLSSHSFRRVIPELTRRGCRVLHSDEVEWGMGIRLESAGIPFSYYRSQEGYRLCRPGMRFTLTPELNHPVIAPEDLEVLLDEDPSAIPELFQK